jgi:hypothetical protein
MNEVVLLFPDTITLTEFLLMYRVPGAEVNTLECSLTCKLTDKQILIACTKHQAHLQVKAEITPDSLDED